MRSLSLLILFSLLAACANAPTVRSATTAAQPSPSYARTFDDLATLIESHHVFAAGRRAFWETHKAALRRELAAADTREAAHRRQTADAWLHLGAPRRAHRRDLGRFSIALSWEGFAGKPPLEGAPISLDWEAPETFETRKTWLDDAVTEATRRLATTK